MIGGRSGTPKVLVIFTTPTIMSEKTPTNKQVFMAISVADKGVKKIFMHQPFAANKQWLCSIVNTRREDGPERNIWPVGVSIDGKKVAPHVAVYWSYNGTRDYDYVLEKFSTLPILRQKWTVMGMGDLPLDTIYTKAEIAKHLMKGDVGGGDPAATDLFGSRYNYGTIDEFFADDEVVAGGLDDDQDSQEALDGLQ